MSGQLTAHTLKHFSIYHDHDARGDVPKRNIFRAFTRTRFTPERVEKDVLDSRVWLIMGHGSSPRRYSLCYWFTAHTFIFAPTPEDENRVSGNEGQQFIPPIPIDTEPWFEAFKKTQFFSRGLSEITNSEVLDGLAELVSRHVDREDEPADDDDNYLDDLNDLDDDFQSQIAESENLTDAELARRIESASIYPEKVDVVTSVFRRNPDVVVAVLRRAAGKCESCGQAAPFLRRSDSSPYLEVHHWDRLADGGPDTVENAAALCPNCHRREHYGPYDAE